MYNNVYRIIDANVNRAMEGLRVVEDIMRFEFNDEIITSMIKNLRSDLKKTIDSLEVSYQQLVKARDSKKDVGADLYTKEEGNRSSITVIITCNFKRVEEALRVLEESSKLWISAAGKEFKNLRYRVYDIEKQAFAKYIS